MPPLVLLAAIDRFRCLGARGPHPLPWRLPADLRRFGAMTLGCPVLMGSHTARSIGRALPHRPNLVLTRGARAPFAGQVAVASLDEALALAAGQSLKVIGGGSVYAIALPRATGVHLTWVDAEIEVSSPVYFPVLGPGWVEVARERIPAGAGNDHAMEFVDYQPSRSLGPPAGRPGLDTGAPG